MTSAHSLHHHQHHHHNSQVQSPPPLPQVHRQPPEEQTILPLRRGSLTGQYSTDRLGGPSSQSQSFAEDRRNGIALPRIAGGGAVEGDSLVSSRNSSPYSSPHLTSRAARPSNAAINDSAMEEITLPPIQAAVPMRRGAVSGASSGPSLPFPPIRPPFEEDDMPSRGPSPTLGKRGSFSMGHSNHVPPGPEVQLPTPVLSGSGERRGTIISIPGFSHHHNSEGSTLDVPRSAVAAVATSRIPDENNYYAPSASSTPQRYGAVPPWSQYKPNISRSGSVEANSVPPALPPYHSSPNSSSYAPGSGSSSLMHRSIYYNDESHRHYSYNRPSSLVSQSYSYAPEVRTVSSTYRMDYQRGGSEMSPASNSSAMHVDSSLSPRMKQGHLVHHDDHYGPPLPPPPPHHHPHHPHQASHQHYSQGEPPHHHAPHYYQHQHHDSESSLNGKRPRSAPRVTSSQPRIFACSQCPARFARNHDLKRHQRGHLSVRPYPCTYCGKSFSRKDALKRHVLVKGCGKDGKGNGGKGGGGKGKKGQDENGERRGPKTEQSSGGDREDGKSEEEEEDDREDGIKSEGNQDDSFQPDVPVTIQQKWNEANQKKIVLSRDGYSKPSSIPKYSTTPTFKSGPSLNALNSLHIKRPSTSVA